MNQVPVQDGSKKARRTSAAGRVAKVSAAASCGALIFILGLEHYRLQAPMNKLIDSDPRNAGIDVSVRYAWHLPSKSLVYDLKIVPLTNSQADVFRVFLQYAQAMKDSEFESVALAFRGTTKFLLDGADFKTLGEEYSWQNPVYTARRFPRKLKRVDGSAAFPEWYGGLLGVVSKEMNDFGEFHREWYLGELTR